MSEAVLFLSKLVTVSPDSPTGDFAGRSLTHLFWEIGVGYEGAFLTSGSVYRSNHRRHLGRSTGSQGVFLGRLNPAALSLGALAASINAAAIDTTATPTVYVPPGFYTQAPTEGFGSTYYGGNKDDWFSINNDLATKSGDRTRWDYLNTVLNKKEMSIVANYAELKSYLDVNNFADYLLGQFYAGVTDWPGNNWWAGGDTPKPMPFKFFAWDSEFQFNTSLAAVAPPPNGAWVHPQFRQGVTNGPG